MPFHLNVMHAAGTMTRKPEVKFTPKGTAVCEVGIAINHVYYVGDEKREETIFLDCEAWGRTAEVIGEYCDKGHTVMFEGRLKQDTWDDKQTGQKRSKIKLSVEKFHFVSKPREQAEGEQGAYERQERPASQQQQRPAFQKRPAPPAKPQDPDLDPNEGDDVPF